MSPEEAKVETKKAVNTVKKLKNETETQAITDLREEVDKPHVMLKEAACFNIRPLNGE